MRRSIVLIASLALLACFASADATAQTSPAATGAVQKGVDFLKGSAPRGQVGEAALAALALIKAEVPFNDAGLGGCLQKVYTRFNGPEYFPERTAGFDIYEAGVIILALSSLDPVNLKPQITACAQYLLSKQKANGSWDYPQRENGDTSISQYAVLGLWEAENSGVRIAPRVWDRIAQWYMSVQAAGGSWNYHRDEAGHPETVSMTAAGVGSLMICQRQLARYRRTGRESYSPLLVPISPEGAELLERYRVTTSEAEFRGAIKRGEAWLMRNFNPENKDLMGHSVYYGLYGMERVGALADKSDIAGFDWFNRGMNFALKTQSGSSWNAEYGDVANTCWALLFLTRGTEKTVRKITVKRLEAGTLLGGRGLPADMDGFTIAQGRVVIRPMNGAIEGMLAVLEDPAALSAESALAGLLARYQTEGPKALRPYKDRFRKLLTDRDQGVRLVAAWALSRTGDLDVAPWLIGSLVNDPDETVVLEAASGLQVLSRKLEGFGPRPGATAEERAEAVRKWRAWYESVRPPESDSAEGSATSGRRAS